MDNTILIEDDAPAVGYSITDGIEEILDGGVVLKKILEIDRLPFKPAYIVMLAYPVTPPEPYNGRHLAFTVNGNKDIIYELKHFWTKAPVPPEHLKLGKNEIEVRIHEPGTQFKTIIALDKNYPLGSTTRHHHPNRSAKSIDNAKTWDFDRLGSKGIVDGEYPIRLNLTAYKPEGWLLSPVIDMAQNSNLDVICQPVKIQSARLDIGKNVPRNTALTTYVRTGSKHFFEANCWSDWIVSSDGNIPSGLLKNRYLQYKIVFESESASHSPELRKVVLETTYRVQKSDAFRNVRVVSSKNQPLINSSLEFSHENALDEKLKQFREKHALDEVVKGSRTEFEKILKLKTWVAKQWEWYLPDSTYPDFSAWDSLRIMAPSRDGKPLGGYCLHFAIVFTQACQSFGIPARIVSMNHALWGGHELTEVWSNDYGKWILMDADFDTFFLDRETGTPLNSIELHKIFLREYYPDEAIDRDTWTREDFTSRVTQKGKDIPVTAVIGGGGKLGMLTEYEWWNFGVDLFAYCGGYGFQNTGYIRFLPRSNFFSQPLPMPLNHGRQVHWGWTGYYCWFDGQTPKSQEHELFTNRESDLYWNLNSVDFSAEMESSDRIQLTMTTRSPNFSHYEVDDNGDVTSIKSDSYQWNLVPGFNRISLRVIDTMGNTGGKSYLELNYLPPDKSK
ncbi:transglutaminase-like domain-containing protein [Candidatus Latescibacterota bacterium]